MSVSPKTRGLIVPLYIFIQFSVFSLMFYFSLLKHDSMLFLNPSKKIFIFFFSLEGGLSEVFTDPSSSSSIIMFGMELLTEGISDVPSETS